MRRKYLLGANTDKELVFAEMEITNRNGYPEFTASFDCVRPFTEDEVNVTEYYESLVDEMDAKWKWEQCERYDCKPSELAECLADDNGDEVMDIKDCSLYPEIITVDDTDYYFESGSCGQHDTRDEMAICTSQNIYNRIHELWDKYHLKEVDQAVFQEFNNIVIAYDSMFKNEEEEKEWIADYIKMEVE